MKQHFMMFAAYNRWANARIYDAALELTGEEFSRPVGTVFGSLMGTLNHLLVTDRIWMKRFTGEGDAPKALDAIIHRGLGPLRVSREAEDESIVDWVASHDEQAMSCRLPYLTVPYMRTDSHWLV